MSEKIVPFPNKINNPRLFKGYETDIIVAGCVCVGVSYVTIQLTLGGLHTILGVFFGTLFGVPSYVYAKKKMNRGYVKHWLWSRGVVSFEKKSSIPFVKEKKHSFMPKGYQVEFRD